MMELYINDQLVDLPPQEQVAVNYATNKFQDLASRNGEYSNRVRLPWTARNKRIIDNSHQPGSTSSFPRGRHSAKIVEDGIVVVDGFCYPENTKNYIELAIFSGNTHWIDLIGENLLQDIDLSDLDHLYHASVIDLNRLTTERFVYPNCDYGGDVQFRPALYMRELTERIFKKIGFTVQGTLFNHPTFNKEVLPFCNRNWQKRFGSTWAKVHFLPHNNILTSGDLADVAAAYTQHLKPTYNPVIVAFGSEWNALGFEMSIALNGPGPISFKPSGFLTFRLMSSFGMGLATLKLVPYTGPDPDQDLGSAIYLGSGVYRININLDTVVLNPLYDYKMQIVFSTAVTEFDCIGGYFEFDDGLDESFPQLMNQFTDLGRSVPPTLKQKDVLKLVFNQFAVQTTTDYQGKIVYLNLFDDAIDDVSKAFDASSLVDHSEMPEVKYSYGDYARANLFKYRDDPNDVDLLPGLGSGSIQIDNELLPPVKDLYKAELAGINRKTIGSVEMCSYPLFTENEIIPRVAYVEINSDNLFNPFGYTALSENSHLFFDDLHFDKLITENYDLINVVVNNQRLINVHLRFKSVHLAGIAEQLSTFITYRKPLYINATIKDVHINGYYYINFISQFKPSRYESCRVELLPLD